MKELEVKIREAFPYLQEINVGQKFESLYYGVITATKITDWDKGVFSIYGYDEGGSPRDCYYPLDLQLIGKPIMLHDVISYVKMKEGEIYDSTDENLISFYYGLKVAFWDLSSVYLTDQNKKVINFLNSL